MPTARLCDCPCTCPACRGPVLPDCPFCLTYRYADAAPVLRAHGLFIHIALVHQVDAPLALLAGYVAMIQFVTEYQTDA